MGSLTLFTAPQLSVLIKSLAEQLTQNSSSDLFELSTVVFPNQHLKDVITWRLTSELNQGTGDELREGCLTGVRKMFISELFGSLSEVFNLPSVPSSEELAWALLSRAHSPSQESPSREVSAAQLADAQRCSELLFRLPFSAPSCLQEEVSFTLPASLSKDHSSQEQLSLKTLWRELLEQRGAQGVNDNTAAFIEGLISPPTEPSEEPSQLSARLSRQLGQLHLIAPKALNVSLLRLLKRASRHININLYLLSAPHEPQALAHQTAFADIEAFKRNLEAIQRYCAPDETRDLSSLTTSHKVKVALHHCHYDARQVEALNERLKQLFDADPTLTQRDVLVLVSDLKRFLPFIEQQFTVGHYSRDRLSAVIVDRGLEEDNPYETLLFSLCSLPTKRVSLELIIELFSLTPVQERFPVSEGRLEQLRSILEGLQLRWGLDEFDQERLTGVASPLHTWRMAIERLMISELMDPMDQPESPYLDLTLPASPLGEADYHALSTFLTFFTTLEQLFMSHPSVSPSHTKAPEAQPYHVWRAWLLNALDQLTVPYHEDKTEGLREFMVREVIHRVERELLRGAHNSAELKLTTSAVMSALSAGLKSYRSVRGRSGIGVTFAPLSVGAGSPARVLAFLGMEEGAVPQKMILSPLDPLNPRHPDRLAVNAQASSAQTSSAPDLEWLREVSYSPSHASSEWASFLSACENTSDELMVFWNATPRFSHDEPIEPCSPVRYLMARYQERLTHQERVSPYDPWYFSAQCTQRPLNKLAYDAAQVISHTLNSPQETPHKSAEAAADTTAQKKQRAPYIARRSTPERVSLNELSKSITNPQELFFQKAGYQLIAPKESSSTSIPLESNKLLSWQVRTDLVESMMSSWQSLRAQGKEGGDVRGEFEATLAPIYQKHYVQLRAQAKLPPGALGRSLYQDMWRQALQYFDQLEKIMIGYQPTPVFNSHLELDFSKDHNLKITLPLTIYKSLENPEEYTVIEYTQSKIKQDSTKTLPLWLTALFLDHFRGRGVSFIENTPPLDIDSISFTLIGLNDTQDKMYFPFDSQGFKAKAVKEKRFHSIAKQSSYQGFSDLPIKTITDVFTHRRKTIQGDKASLIWNFSLYDEMKKNKTLEEVVLSNREKKSEDYLKYNQTQLDIQCQHIYQDDDIYLSLNKAASCVYKEHFERCGKLFAHLQNPDRQ